jgi:hypothetical protein
MISSDLNCYENEWEKYETVINTVVVSTYYMRFGAGSIGAETETHPIAALASQK